MSTSIFNGQSKYSVAAQALRKERDKRVKETQKSLVDPNSGLRGVFKAFQGASGSAASLAADAGRIAAGDVTAVAGGIGSTADIVGAVAQPILEAKKGREIISQIKEQATEDLNEVDMKKRKSAAQAISESQGYKSGGVVKGAGTGKSDSIPAKVDASSFVVPVEKADIALKLGQQYLGWSADQKTSKIGGDTDVKLSDGEVLFAPEEADALRKYGFNLDQLAPGAKTINGQKYLEKNGTLYAATDEQVIENGVKNKHAAGYKDGGDVKPKLTTLDAIAYGTSAAQTLVGLGMSLSKDKGQPEFKPTDLSMLDKGNSGFGDLANKIREKGAGIVKYLRSSILRNASNTFASEQKALSEKSGGNASAYLKGVGGAGSRKNAAVLAGESKAAEILSAVENGAVNLEAEGLKTKNANAVTKANIKASENRYDHQTKSAYNLEMDKAKGTTAAGLINAGISNATGYTSFKEQTKKTADRKENSKITYGSGNSEIDNLVSSSDSYYQFLTKLKGNKKLNDNISQDELKKIKDNYFKKK